jgi:hypothetical protein
MIRGHDLWNSIQEEAVADSFLGCYNLFELSAPLSRDTMPEDLAAATDIVYSNIFYFRGFAACVQILRCSRSLNFTYQIMAVDAEGVGRGGWLSPHTNDQRIQRSSSSDLTLIGL